jgi:hypothetical protein
MVFSANLLSPMPKAPKMEKIPMRLVTTAASRTVMSVMASPPADN